MTDTQHSQTGASAHPPVPVDATKVVVGTGSLFTAAGLVVAGIWAVGMFLVNGVNGRLDEMQNTLNRYDGRLDTVAEDVAYLKGLADRTIGGPEFDDMLRQHGSALEYIDPFDDLEKETIPGAIQRIANLNLDGATGRPLIEVGQDDTAPASFQSVYSLWESTGVLAELSDETKDFFVVAPTDRAFEEAGVDVSALIRSDGTTLPAALLAVQPITAEVFEAEDFVTKVLISDFANVLADENFEPLVKDFLDDLKNDTNNRSIGIPNAMLGMPYRALTGTKSDGFLMETANGTIQVSDKLWVPSSIAMGTNPED